LIEGLPRQVGAFLQVGRFCGQQRLLGLGEGPLVAGQLDRFFGSGQTLLLPLSDLGLGGRQLVV